MSELMGLLLFLLYSILQTTLLHTAPTLTDLDLSFAYIGYPGAEVSIVVVVDAVVVVVVVVE